MTAKSETVLSYDIFREDILRLLKNALEPEKEISTSPVLKNNGVYLEGIVLDNPSHGISPTFYMEDLYEMHREGLSPDEIIDYIVPFYEKEYNGDFFGQNTIEDYAKIKDSLFVKLINTQKNAGLLKDCPSRPFLDMSAVLYLSLLDDSGQPGAVTVSESILEAWNKPFNDVYETALRNTGDILGTSITDIHRFLAELVGNCDELPLSAMSPGQPRFPMYIMTNTKRVFGASCILLDKIKEFAEAIDYDLYIIPSSIHEVILVPVQDGIFPDELKEVLNEVNATELSSAEFLSDRIYCYRRDLMEITV